MAGYFMLGQVMSRYVSLIRLCQVISG